ncbi:MAG TPA: Abi family protein [Armatimonadota bacterium]|nr:Abi family protein [Armatimonadota bacterium]
MRYLKPPLRFDEQADLLLGRGLHADRDVLIERLQTVNYYRLSAYLYPYRQAGSDDYRAGTTLDAVWRHYTFDRQLRFLVLDAIERVEVAVRAQAVCRFAEQHGAFGYLQQHNFPHMSVSDHATWLADLRSEKRRSHEKFLQHFDRKYGDMHTMPPLWMMAELMSFGRMLMFFNTIGAPLQGRIAEEYGISGHVLASWLHALSVIRNICAHHARLWNRELGVKPVIPHKKKHPQWHEPVAIANNRVFAILTILRYLLRVVAPTSAWPNRFCNLLSRYPEIDINNMGFPDNWASSPLWQ